MASARQTQKRILIVDDDVAVRELVSRCLEKEGVETVKAADGLEGLLQFESQPFDLVITDRVMPFLGGEQVAAAIKEWSSGTPVVLITGVFQGPIIATHFDGFLIKPFTRIQLLGALDELLPEWRDGALLPLEEDVRGTVNAIGPV